MVAEGFAAAGRHNGEGILPVEDVGDDFGLERPEMVVAEDGFEEVLGVGESG